MSSSVFIRLGECNRCGKCCDPATMAKRMTVYRALGVPVLLNPRYPCPHFSYVDGWGRCAIYDRRPQMCRDFPRIPEDVLGLPECGYWFFEARQREK